jgi:RNA ligase
MAHVEALGFTLASLQREIDAGYISCQSHPSLPLKIYNYTVKTQIEQHWNNVTMWCRGLILENDQIIAQPMKKFFNYGEPSWGVTAEYARAYSRDHGKPSIYEKLDGSLGIMWTYTDRNLTRHYGVATRGSFTSPQAQWATEWLTKHIAALRSRGRVFECYLGWTLMFEIIYPANRIVCKYDWSGLVLIAATRNSYLGAEMKTRNLMGVGEYNYLRVVKQTSKTLEQCLAEDTPNKEGYVVVWHRGSSYPAIRAKIKHANYVRLHKVITTNNPKQLWQMLKDGDSLDSLIGRDMPEHFRDFVKGWQDKLMGQFYEIEKKAKTVVNECQLPWLPKDREARKALAAHFSNYKDISSILFAILDDINYRNIIFDMIKPKGNDTLNREEAA